MPAATTTRRKERSTHHGDVLGSPAYMSPEQASGRGDQVERRSDIYSLGAVLFELLTLRTPCELAPGEDIPALIEDLSGLLFASHAALVAGLRSGGDDLPATFAQVTRQTLRLIVEGDDYGRLLFDAGLPVDRFVSGLRAAMGADIAAGVRRGVFVADDLDVAISNQCGRLLANVAIAYNSMLLSRLLERYQATGNQKAPQSLKAISPVAWQHIHFLGHYTFRDNRHPIDLDALLANVTLG